MKIKYYACTVGGAIVLLLVGYHYAQVISYTNLSEMLADDVGANGPGWLIAIGLGLFGIRALIAKTDKTKS